MTSSIYVGAPTAWQHSRNAEAAWASREKRVATRQANRVRTIAVLIIFTLIEGVAIKMGSLAQMQWLEIAGVACIFCNIPLIGWLGRLWLRDYRREKEIRNQYNKR